MSRKHRSQKQIAASRANGRLSKGPVTAEGKARSSINALKDTRSISLTAVVNGEDSAGFLESLDHFILRFQPADPVELRLVRKLATIDWRLCRYTDIESHILNQQMALMQPAYEASGLEPTARDRISTAQRKLADESKVRQFLAQRQCLLNRAYQTTLIQLHTIRQKFPMADPSSQLKQELALRPNMEPHNEPKPDPALSAANPLPEPEPEHNQLEYASELPIDYLLHQAVVTLQPDQLGALQRMYRRGGKSDRADRIAELIQIKELAPEQGPQNKPGEQAA